MFDLWGYPEEEFVSEEQMLAPIYKLGEANISGA